MVANEVERLSVDVVLRAAKLATSTLANALDDTGLHNQVFSTLKAVSPGMRFTGPAMTVQEITAEHGTYTSADFRVGAIIDAAQTGDVVVIDMADRGQVFHLGRHGVAGGEGEGCWRPTCGWRRS